MKLRRRRSSAQPELAGPSRKGATVHPALKEESESEDSPVRGVIGSNKVYFTTKRSLQTSYYLLVQRDRVGESPGLTNGAHWPEFVEPWLTLVLSLLMIAVGKTTIFSSRVPKILHQFDLLPRNSGRVARVLPGRDQGSLRQRRHKWFYLRSHYKVQMSQAIHSFRN